MDECEELAFQKVRKVVINPLTVYWTLNENLFGTRTSDIKVMTI